MAPPSLVDDVRQLSRDLGQILACLPLEELDIEDNQPSFVFELKVLFKLLQQLKHQGWSINVISPSVGLVFLRAPGPKSAASYFEVVRNDTGEGFQVVHGSQILDRTRRKHRAPDISIQRQTAGPNPTWEDVHAIWDAKLRGKTATLTRKRITDSEFSKFLLFMDVLRVPPPGTDRE